MRFRVPLVFGFKIPSTVLWVGVLAGCSSTEAPPPSSIPDAGSAPPEAGSTTLALIAACSDTRDSIYADPGPLSAERGTVLRCATDSDKTAAELEAVVRANGYVGAPFTSGAKIVRLLFRTERGDSNGSPGVSSALAYVPDKPRSTAPPVVVASHGSRGQAAACAPSRNDPAGEYVQSDFERQVLPLVGFGYPVIAPDWAGYSNYGAPGNPPSVYAGVNDVGKSVLDAARAMKRALGGEADAVALVGHSQGGHSTLSALAIAETYAPELAIGAVVTYAPLWLSQRSWGALFFLNDQYPIRDQPAVNAVSVWYHYTHGELLDGPGHGLDVFAASKRAQIKEFVDGTCWSASYPALEALGATPKDLFDADYVNAITFPAAGFGQCSNELCTKWMNRFSEDRPHLKGKALAVPILVPYGRRDTTIPPERAACAFDRLKSDGARTTLCLDATAGHSDVIDKHADYVAAWLGHHLLGEPAPGTCGSGDTALVDDAKNPIVCAVPPPND